MALIVILMLFFSCLIIIVFHIMCNPYFFSLLVSYHARRLVMIPFLKPVRALICLPFPWQCYNWDVLFNHPMASSPANRGKSILMDQKFPLCDSASCSSCWTFDELPLSVCLGWEYSLRSREDYFIIVISLECILLAGLGVYISGPLGWSGLEMWKLTRFNLRTVLGLSFRSPCLWISPP